MFWDTIALFLTSPLQSLTGDLLSIGVFVRLVLGLVGFLTSFILISLLFDTIWIHLTTYGLGTLPLLLLPFNLAFGLIVALVLLLILLITDRITQFELRLHTRVNLSHIYNHKLTLLSTSISFIVAFLFLISSQGQITTANITIPSSLLDQALKVSQPIINDQLIKQQDALYDNLLSQLDEQLPYLKDIPDDDKIQLLTGKVTETVRGAFVNQGFSDQQIDALALQLQQTTKLSLPEDQQQNITNAANDLTSEFMQTLKTEVEKTVNSYLDANIKYVPWIVSAVVLITFNSFGIIVKLISILFAAVLLRIFVALHLVDKTSVSQPVELYRITSQNKKLPEEKKT